MERSVHITRTLRFAALGCCLLISPAFAQHDNHGGGALSAGRAVEVPVVAFDGVGAGPVAPLGEIVVAGDSRAAGGSLFVAVDHGPELVVDHPSAVPFADGDPVPVPGAEYDADGSGTWLVLDLPADGPLEARIPLVAAETGAVDVQVRAVPFAGDLVGAEASFEVTLDLEAAAEPEPTPTPTDEPDETDEPGADPQPSEAGGCGCATTTGGGGSMLALAVGFTFVRRVSRSRRTARP